MDITNKTPRPLSVPLPGNKRLHLGPGRTGQVTPKALEHPPLKALVDDGTLEVSGQRGASSRGRDGDGGGSKGPSSGQGRGGPGVFKSGDR
jgi:hypothetical protein